MVPTTDTTAARAARPRRRTAVLAAAAALGALVLAGCGVQPGVAAQVADRVITQDELERTREDLSQFVQGADAGAVLVAMVVGPLFVDAAADAGVGVSRDAARTVIAETTAASGAPAPEVGEGVVEVIRFTMAVQNLQALPDGAEILAEVDESIGGLDIDVNPRYGQFDALAGAITPEAEPWIVAPTP